MRVDKSAVRGFKEQAEEILAAGEKPTIPDVLPLVLEYYQDNLAGGSLHIVLDDGNVDDEDVETCIKWARENNDERGEILGRVLLRMSRTQRRKLYAASKLLDYGPARWVRCVYEQPK